MIGVCQQKDLRYIDELFEARESEFIDRGWIIDTRSKML